ncbi:MAG: hypothetical protein J0G33_05825 [Afipia felis]|nr:hypothetical protein [Afipia felis]
MIFQIFGQSHLRAGSRCRGLRNKSIFSDVSHQKDTSRKPVCLNNARIIATWHLNAETGQLECTWKADDELGPGSSWLRAMERWGTMLAVYQQGRFAA